MFWFLVVAILKGESSDWSYYCGASPPHSYQPDLSLEAVEIFFRHGARTSLEDDACFAGKQANYECAKTSIFGINKETLTISKQYPGGCETGQLLLPLASSQLSNLAKWIKETYKLSESECTGNFFNSPSTTTFRSTDKQRTLATLLEVTRNLFPEEYTTPLEVITADYDTDALCMNRPCPRAAYLSSEYKRTKIHAEIFETAQECGKRWKSEVGTEFAAHALDCLLSARCAKASLPVEVSDELFECVYDTVMKDRAAFYGKVVDGSSEFVDRSREFCRLSVSPVFEELRSKWAENSKSGLVATHDTTLICMLQALGGLWSGRWPKYAESISFENHLIDGESFFKVIVDGEPVKDSYDNLFFPMSVLDDIIMNDDCYLKENVEIVEI